MLPKRADLPREQTEKLQQQLSQRIERLAKYWGAPLQGQVRCNVVADVKNWADTFAPDVEQQLKARAGTTITQRRSIGVSCPRCQAKAMMKIVVSGLLA